MVHEARRLGMSHANVYRHFSNKAALRNAVAARWLHAIAAQLDAITEQGGDAATRLEIWLLALVRAKQRKVLDEPEMFAAFHALAEAAHTAVAAHVAELERQLPGSLPMASLPPPCASITGISSPMPGRIGRRS